MQNTKTTKHIILTYFKNVEITGGATKTMEPHGDHEEIIGKTRNPWKSWRPYKTKENNRKHSKTYFKTILKAKSQIEPYHKF